MPVIITKSICRRCILCYKELTFTNALRKRTFTVNEILFAEIATVFIDVICFNNVDFILLAGT